MKGYFQHYVQLLWELQKQLKTVLVGQISVKTEKGIIVLIPAGSKAIFTALTELDVQLGLILSEIESRAEQVNTILNNIK